MMHTAKSKDELVQSCGICRYYKKFEPDEEEPKTDDEEEEEEDPETVTGICRRFPPTLFPSVVSTTAWPEVSAKTGWCGEFTPA